MSGGEQGLLFTALRRELRAPISPKTHHLPCVLLGAFISLGVPKRGKEKTGKRLQQKVVWLECYIP